MHKILFTRLLICSLVITASCHNKNGADEADSAGILTGPAFAGITDSIAQSPANVSLYLRRASRLSAINQHELANLDLAKAWQIQPSQQVASGYAASLSILGRQAEKLELLKDCIRRFPDSLGFKRLLGEAYAETGRSKEAVVLFDSLLLKDSLDFEAWYEKGLLQEELRDTSGAIYSLSRAVSLQPVNTYALELAHLYAEMSNPMALTLADQVLYSDRIAELPDPYFIKGIYYSNIGRYDQAVIQFDSCIRRDWKFSDAYIEKGIAFFKQKNYDAGLNTFRMGATVSNSNPDAYYWIGRCFEAINKKEEAAQNYERALALDNNFAEARAALKRVEGSK